MAGSVWVAQRAEVSGGDGIAWLACLLTVTVGLLMVSNIRYHSFKEFDIRGKVPFISLVIMMLGFALLLWHPPLVLFLLFLSYAVSGPVLTLIQLRRRRAARQQGVASEVEGEE